MGTTPTTPASAGPAPSKIQTLARAVQITAKEVQPNIRLYTQDEDQLQLVALSNFANAQLQFTLRYLMPDGQIIPTVVVVTAPNAGVFAQVIQNVPEGFLLTADFQSTTLLSAGQWVFGNITLSRGYPNTPTAFSEILSGYCTGRYNPSWPEWQPQRPLDGPGTIRTIIGTTPAAGTEINEVVPVNRRWELLSLRALLTTSATVANRQPLFAIKDAVGDIDFTSQSGIAQAASLAWNYTLAPFGFPATQNLLEVSMPLFPKRILGSGYIINTSTTGLQAGDQWSAPRYTVLEWADLE